MKSTLQSGLELREDLQDKGISISAEFVIKVWENQVEFILADEDGKRVFGGDVSVNGYSDFITGDREIKINKGSMGPFDMTCEASVKSTLLVATMIENFEEFSESVEFAMDRVANQK
jgi:hypothetical protein